MAYQTLSEQASPRAGLFGIAARLAVQQGLAEDRCVLLLYCLEGFTCADIAKMLDHSAAAVRRKLRRAKAALG
jgi:DNA-directed RNA polymerase specialized sigma24 family protein